MPQNLASLDFRRPAAGQGPGSAVPGCLPREEERPAGEPGPGPGPGTRTGGAVQAGLQVCSGGCQLTIHTLSPFRVVEFGREQEARF